MSETGTKEEGSVRELRTIFNRVVDYILFTPKQRKQLVDAIADSTPILDTTAPNALTLLASFRNADRIAVLHSGRIVEYGTHDELIQKEGYYTELHNKQLLEEELARV